MGVQVPSPAPLKNPVELWFNFFCVVNFLIKNFFYIMNKYVILNLGDTYDFEWN